MSSRRETNPHFVRPSHHVEDQQHHQPISPWSPLGSTQQEERPLQPLHGSKKPRRQKPRDPVPVQPPHGLAAGPSRLHQQDQHHPVPGVVPVPPPSHRDHTDHPTPHGAAPVVTLQGDHDPRGRPHARVGPQDDYDPRGRPYDLHGRPHARVGQPSHRDGIHLPPQLKTNFLAWLSGHPKPHGAAPVVPPQGDHDPRGRPHARVGIHLPPQLKTNFFAWFLAVFCAILWVLIILGGVVILIVYLIFRPRSPRFEISAAALNAAYLDMGYLLNADATFLANFSNPNRKVSVDFSTMYVELYYGRTLIATQYVEPFSAPKASSGFRYIHMVTSQVRLPEIEIQRLKRQLVNNGVIVELKGYLKARSKFGGLFRYSYWLHGRCTLLLTRPPDGVLIGKKCKTKH